MTTENTKQLRATPVPKSFDRILQGALKLPLQERATIANKLIEANKIEMAHRQQQAKEAEAIVNGGGTTP